jgi:hypothetical protein
LIYNRQVTVAASSVIEVFDEIGISPERCDVSIQVLGGTSVYLVEDGSGTNPGPKLSWATSPSEPYRLVTDKDLVYVKNFDSGNSAVVCLSLTAVP